MPFSVLVALAGEQAEAEASARQSSKGRNQLGSRSEHQEEAGVAEIKASAMQMIPLFLGFTLPWVPPGHERRQSHTICTEMRKSTQADMHAS